MKNYLLHRINVNYTNYSSSELKMIFQAVYELLEKIQILVHTFGFIRLSICDYSIRSILHAM